MRCLVLSELRGDLRRGGLCFRAVTVLWRIRVWRWPSRRDGRTIER